ncbi:hypothetical protein [Maribellus maritimus]|uniref:hypothetical protein n=1 Tax=Maribellus maritimus TaxID=2870838 RepID=UPI001EEAF1F2|nr:hypothetical protein [Maribellus maritimus]MCG6186766.1 hypothetical protein [Maribellus maritimus]
MKNLISILTLVSIVVFSACNSKNKSDEIANYAYEEKTAELNKELQNKVGDWIEKGSVCYGLVVAIDGSGTPKHGKPVKAKVVRISDDEIKMKALEKINIGPKEGCSEMGISRGETWMEKDGELFQTKDEAVTYLKDKGLFMEE